MTETQHTPGPWSVYLGNEKQFANTPLILDNSIPAVVVARVGDYPQRTANAALIAEAPAMLAALEALFEHCEMIHKDWGENCNQKEADAAIADGQAVLDRIRGQE